MKKPLIDALIRTVAAPASGRVEISDERCSGLFRVTANGGAARRFKKTAEADERALTVHILPKWGARPYHCIGRRDVIELCEGIVAPASLFRQTGCRRSSAR